MIQCVYMLLSWITNILVFEGSDECKVDMVFCIDSSGSVGFSARAYDIFTMILTFAQDIAKQFNVRADKTRVGCVRFGMLLICSITTLSLVQYPL